MALVRHSPLPYISDLLGKEFPREPDGSRHVFWFYSGEFNQGATRSPDKLFPRHLRNPGRRIVRGGQITMPLRTRRSHMRMISGNPRNHDCLAKRDPGKCSFRSLEPRGQYRGVLSARRKLIVERGLFVTWIRSMAAQNRQFTRHLRNRICSNDRFMASDERMREPTTGKTQRRNMT